jgi:hypothetical protein
MTQVSPSLSPNVGTSRVVQRGGGGAPASAFTPMDLSTATIVDPNSLFDAGASTLGTTSTIAVNNAHGLWDGALDGLGFFFSLGALPALVENNSGVVLRLKFASTTAVNPWRIALGVDGNSGAPAWAAGGQMGGMLQGNCNARRDLIGGGGSSGSNLGAGNLGRFVDTYIQFNPLSTGNTGPAVRGILVTVSDAAKTSCATVGAQVNPGTNLAGIGYAILGIGNTSVGPASVYTGVEASYQLVPRQP